jgi:hypothetical protein
MKTLLFAAGLLMARGAFAAGTFVIAGGTVHPVSGPEIPGGMVVVENGKITAVGANAAIPAGANLGLGCGNPLAFAETHAGETVVDIGPVWEEKLALVRCYRHALKKEVWEAPRGFIDTGESPAEAALRERQPGVVAG